MLVDGYTCGSLSMAAYMLGADCHVEGGPGEAGLAVPDAPGEDTNI